jgi:hypothetical protein
MQKEYKRGVGIGMTTDRLIQKIDEHEEFVTLEDGFVSFWPRENRGALTANDLRVIADELDSRNEKWEKEINNYFVKIANSQEPLGKEFEGPLQQALDESLEDIQYKNDTI